MPLGVSLTDLRKRLRAETGQSLNAQQGVQSAETQNMVLDRQQRELWDAYQWPHLRYARDIDLGDGQALYSYPVEMPFDQIQRIGIATGSTTSGTTAWSDWHPLIYGINLLSIPASGPPTGTPTHWANQVVVGSTGVTVPGGQIYLYPTPSFPETGNMRIRLSGQAPCTSLQSESDRCIIDSEAIVLFAAAEVLAVQKSEAASLKLTKAQNFLRRLLQNSGADKRASYNMGGVRRIDHLGRRPYAVAGLDYIP
jgi:hypothetical protein